ncbi:DNA translocase FtsK [Salinibacter sp. 10B]|uniref:FtsK/SpoIIIE family DNA translocase n=1 Tax=Salinibacter sp. 10B TaxID=1923971 RepID=UPI000CF422A7|nr:DNA translocase FtsK [Salinibacter sp. 10B]
MASSSSSTATSTSPVIPPRRKWEVLGLVLMVLALLLSLAFLSYAPADDAVAKSAPLVEALLNPSEYPPVQNALGLLGAELARSLVPGFLGYSILIFSLALMVWGYAIFRHWTLQPLLYPTGLALLSAFVIAGFIGWFAHALQVNLVRWAGAVGMGMAGWMQGVFGPPGSFILLLLVVAIMLLLVVDHDIQRSIDRVIDTIRQIENKIQSWVAAWRERRARKKRARETDDRDDARSHDTESSSRSTQSEQASHSEEETEASEASPSAQTERTDTASSSAESSTSQQQSSASDAPADADTPHAEADTESDTTSPDEESPPNTSSPPRPITIQVPDSVGDGRPLRRNDLFRGRLRNRDASAEQDEQEPSDELDLEELEEEFGEALEEVSESEEFEESEESDPHANAEESSAFESSHSSGKEDTADASAQTQTAPSEASASASSEDETTTPESSSPTAEPTPSADASTDEPSDDTSQTDSDESTAAPSDADDVELTVKERVEEEKADEIERAAETPEQVEYESPALDLLEEPSDTDPTVNREELEKNKRILLDKLDTYNVEVDDISAVVGPTVTRYELTPAPGVKVSRIKSLEDDLAMALAAPSVRMMAPIPGKSAVGVEIPNSSRELVRLREVLGTAKFRDTDMTLPIAMGKTIEGEVFLADLTKMPHLLIAGATGSGKSVGLNSLITGLIYACHPMNLRFVIIDPKKIELQQYTALDTQFVAQPQDVDQTVITDIEEASGVLKSVEKEMEERYDLLSEASVRGIEGYNEKFKAGELSPEDGHRHMPYIVVVVDELADLMMAVGDDIEGPISRLAQMARAVGIHLILATQRPSVDVITGVIKANFPSRIAYEVASMADSRTILDQGGAEGLVGNGDMLFLSGSDMRRLQGPFVSVEEVEDVVDFVSQQPGVTPYELPSLLDAGHGPDETLGVEDTDEHFEEAARVTVRRQQGSVSLLQRKLAVGYTRAARIVDQLEEAGIVGPHNGTKARDVLVDSEEELDRLLQGEDVEADA